MGLELYDAQEEAIFELLAGNHVILNTPTGSGKSLVGVAAHYAALAADKRSVYTAPIKALVSEKFFALCREFGSERVGMITGDASVNADAPIICCTAEILANWALRDGANTPVDVAVVDEFHYYGDPQRGWAWQIPLLELPHTQFLLMSATLGSIDFFERDLTKRTGRRDRVVSSVTRPVPARVRVSPHHAPRQCRRAAQHRTSPDLSRALHPARGDRGGPGLPLARSPDQGREGAAEGGDRRFPLRLADRQGSSSVHQRRESACTTRAATQVPTAGREAGPGRTAEDHLWHRHARGRRERPDPLGVVHPALQVRRTVEPDPPESRVPADLGPGRAQGFRRSGHRVGPGSSPHRRQLEGRGEGGRERQEEGGQEEAARAWVLTLDRGHLHQDDQRRPRTASLAFPGQPSDGHEPARPPCDRRRRRL